MSTLLWWPWIWTRLRVEGERASGSLFALAGKWEKMIDSPAALSRGSTKAVGSVGAVETHWYATSCRLRATRSKGANLGSRSDNEAASPRPRASLRAASSAPRTPQRQVRSFFFPLVTLASTCTVRTDNIPAQAYSCPLQPRQVN